MEPSEDHSEEQSEGVAKELGEPVYEELANELAREQSRAALPGASKTHLSAPGLQCSSPFPSTACGLVIAEFR